MKRSIRTVVIVMIAIFLVGATEISAFHATTLDVASTRRGGYDAAGFNTVVNFRDLNQYTMKDGRKIAPNRLLRSGELYRISPEDITLLRERNNLKRIVDLRTMGEVKEKPDEIIAGTVYHHINMFEGNEDEAPVLAGLMQQVSAFDARNRNVVRNADYAEKEMMGGYKYLAVNPVAHRGFRRFIDVVINNKDGALLWHCFAGKDRTGLAAALILYILGASEATIYDDYLRTNEQRKAANEAMLAEIAKMGANEDDLAYARVKLNVRKEYLDHAIQLVKDNYGSMDNYVENVIGISAAEQAQLRDMYLL